MSVARLDVREAAREELSRSYVRSSSGDLWMLWVAFGIATALTFSSTVDDAFITLRYAHNILNGFGPVFNPGQRVNGATSPAGLVLATLVLTIPGGFVMLKLKVLSLLFGGLTVGWSKKLVDGLCLPVFCKRTALILIGASPIIGFGSASGLETTLEAFALVGLIVELRSGQAFTQPRRAAFFAAAAIASRPEAVLLIAVVATTAFAVERAFGRWARVRWAFPAAIVETAILAANRSYYGSWLPNTYRAKHIPLGHAASGGFSYLLHGWELSYFWTSFGGRLFSVTLMVIADGILLAGVLSALVRFRQLGYLGAVSIAQSVFILSSGGDWIQGSRFLLPVVPFLVVLALNAVASAWVALERSAVVATVLVGGFAVTTCFPYIPAATAHTGPVWDLRSVSDKRLVASGGSPFSRVWADSPGLVSCVPKGGLVALTETGYVGFARSDLRILDLRGLTSREIADSAPRSARHYYGIQDPKWASTDSPVGKIILRSEPDAILTIDPNLGPILDGRYQLGAIDSTPGVTMALYARVGGPCQSFSRVLTTDRSRPQEGNDRVYSESIAVAPKSSNDAGRNRSDD